MVLERAQGPAPWDGVVDLRGLQAPPLDGSSAEEQLVAVRRALDPLMVLAGAPRGAGNAASPRVWVITRGAQATARGAADPAAAALWGMGRVLANENPRLWGGLIDLDEGRSPDRDARMVLGALTDPGDDDQIVFRDGRRLVPRLTAVAAELDEPLIELHGDGAYLVTGGFGGLGTEVSRFLTDRGARRLVLVSRSGDVTSGNGRSGEAARRAAAVRALEARGATVEVAAVDVADETALAELVRTREAAALPPISGVFHAAGVTRDKLMSKLDGDDVDAVLRSKVGGAWALHRVLGDVRYFVLFSSISSVLGPIGQGPYAAANAYLDALAHFRRERGLAATSISWGPWADIGMMAGRAASEGDGIEGMSVAEGLRALSWIVRHQPVHVTVVRADWERVAARAERPVPLLTPLLPGGSAALAAITPTPILQRLLLMPEEERRAELEALMRDLAAHVMRLPTSQLDVRQPLNALGIDSIMAVEFRHQVEATVGLTFSIVELLEGPASRRWRRASRASSRQTTRSADCWTRSSACPTTTSAPCSRRRKVPNDRRPRPDPDPLGQQARASRALAPQQAPARPPARARAAKRVRRRGARGRARRTNARAAAPAPTAAHPCSCGGETPASRSRGGVQGGRVDRGDRRAIYAPDGRPAHPPQADQLPKLGLRVFLPSADNADIAARVEVGPTRLLPVPTFQVDRGRLENLLAYEAQRAGVTVLGGGRVLDVSLRRGSHSVTVGGAAEATIAARWVADASGRAGLLKRRLGLAENVAHDANAAWFRIGAELDVATWSQDLVWQRKIFPGLRRLSTNHLMGRGYWVWLIRSPLARRAWASSLTRRCTRSRRSTASTACSRGCGVTSPSARRRLRTRAICCKTSTSGGGSRTGAGSYSRPTAGPSPARRACSLTRCTRPAATASPCPTTASPTWWSATWLASRSPVGPRCSTGSCWTSGSRRTSSTTRASTA